MRFIRGHVGYLKRRETITPELWREDDRGFTSPCWIWTQVPKTKAGYCRVQLRGVSVLAHRAMYEQEVGPIPKGLTIDHLCKQTSCVNPEHLEAVTHAVNNQRGLQTKITHEIVRAVRAASGTNAEIGARFGLTGSHVWYIRTRRLWKNVD